MPLYPKISERDDVCILGTGRTGYLIDVDLGLGRGLEEGAVVELAR